MNIVIKLIKSINFAILTILLALTGCSGMESSQRERVRRENAVSEPITRRHDEHGFVVAAPRSLERQLYIWEEAYAGNMPRITKEYFRCRGNSLNPSYLVHEGTRHEHYLFDCEGGHRHSLPLQEGREHIYPILVDLLNFVQQKTGRRVRITCGHRCPEHNTYADASNNNLASKHMIGAEVDFYVEGLEDQPQKIVDLIKRFYEEDARYAGKEEFERFVQWDGKTNVSTQPWYNKEIFIKLAQSNEARDIDNTHPYPYLTIQVRYDRDTQKRVVYTWDGAHNNFRRQR